MNRDWSSIALALRDWRGTHSPLAYWHNQLGMDHYLQRARNLAMSVKELQRGVNISFGLPTEEAMRVCRDAYTNSIAKLTIQVGIKNLNADEFLNF